MSQQQHLRVDPKIWQKIAGDSFTVPKLHSRIYYFPQGHLQHVCPNTQTLDRCRPLILCTVSAVDLFADPETDQVYAKLLLTPVIDGSVVPLESDNGADGDQIVSYAKTLTNTDVRSGAVLYIPRAGAEAILPALPPLDSRNQSRFQDISVKDVCGVVSEIRHFHRLCPFQHLFTVGWSGFVSKKKLVVGDTVVFVKNSNGNISIGIRRNGKLAAAAKMTEKEVKLAVELAEKNAAFEVVYYPTVGGFDFVVGAKIVEDAMKVNWSRWMRVTHMVKNDDTSKGCSIFNGTICAISHPSTRPWRMLQVEWDEPHVPENLKQISPWQVEIIRNRRTPPYIMSPPTKRFRGAQASVSSSIPNNMQNLVSTPTSSNFKTKKTTPGSIVLFGKTIQPIESDLYNSDSKGDHEVEGIHKT
ncbi:auxin response factor 17-like [Vicia villosa]|uniref:auxin response factor 17-like n=1 Tax=Vicia villosa TaxID=3911 RepID=UPI00273B31D5|nr:auxin response factor 17-like [Vicia villosa]